jgi:oligopeptidase B
MEEAMDHPVPFYLYGYGAYEYAVDDLFEWTRLPLLDRGVIYAVADVRGGGELGHSWYENGRLLKKKHSFDDFIDVARYFIETKEWTTPDLLACEGRSAGGLLIGAVLNQAPELFRAAILGVPFVDILATMSDATIPLTTPEWLAWGNPNEEKYFEYMKSYSPMNNVRTGTPYPSMFISGGLYDSRVAYWEPAKYTATLRHTVTNPSDRPIFLKMEMTSGHFGGNGRYQVLKLQAGEYAFVIDQLGLNS